MKCGPLIYDDCCLLSNIRLNSERISYILECRFKKNSIRTSFDFKSIPPQVPSLNAKVTRSLLKVDQKKIQSLNNDDNESISTESSDNANEEIPLLKTQIDTIDDDYLNRLAQWEPNNLQPSIENDDDEQEIENTTEVVTNENNSSEPMDVLSGKFDTWYLIAQNTRR